jgi:hypothetical protein
MPDDIAGKSNGIFTVGAAYSYGDNSRSDLFDAYFSHPMELLDYLMV